MSSSDFFFRTHSVFTHDEYARSRGSVSLRTIDSLLSKHIASGRIVRIRRGLYVSAQPGTTAEGVDPFLVATKAAPDAAVSHHAALQFHGRAYSVWSQITFLTNSAARPFSFGAVEYIPVRPPAPVAARPDMGGGIEISPSADAQVRVCSCERAMVDVLHMPELGGGWEEIWRSFSVERPTRRWTQPFTLPLASSDQLVAGSNRSPCRYRPKRLSFWLSHFSS